MSVVGTEENVLHSSGVDKRVDMSFMIISISKQIHPLIVVLRSQVVSSKLGLTRELSVSRINESTTGYTFTTCVGSFTSSGIYTR